MLIRRAILATLIMSLFTPSTAFADQVSKQAKLLELIRLTGIETSFDEQVAQLKQQNANVAQTVVQSARAELPGLPDAVYTEMQQEAEALLNQLNADLDAAQMAKQYAKYYGEHLTAADVDELIAFYQSPIGQKASVASQKATRQWTQQFLTDYQTKLQQEAQVFFVKMRSIAEKYSEAQPVD